MLGSYFRSFDMVWCIHEISFLIGLLGSELWQGLMYPWDIFPYPWIAKYIPEISFLHEIIPRIIYPTQHHPTDNFCCPWISKDISEMSLLRCPPGIPEITNHCLRYLWSIPSLPEIPLVYQYSFPGILSNLLFCFRNRISRMWASYWKRLPKDQHSTADRTSSADRSTLGGCPGQAANAGLVCCSGGSTRIGPPRSIGAGIAAGSCTEVQADHQRCTQQRRAAKWKLLQPLFHLPTVQPTRYIDVWEFLESIDQHFLHLHVETRMQQDEGFALM